MILLCGLPSETPIELVREELERLGAPHLALDPRRTADADLEVEVRDGEVEGRLRVDGRWHPLAAVRAVYSRWVDPESLPPLARLPADSGRRRHARHFQDALIRWMEVAPVRVVNRASAMSSNSSKPYQSQAVRRAGFAIPETLITNDPAQVEEFAAACGEVIYKSISGVRSVVQPLGRDDLRRLERVRWCPVQFQQKVPGDDVRVHTVGGKVFATRIASPATDYRYAVRQTGEAARFAPFELPPEEACRCLRLAADLGLDFAGIDLKRTPEGRYYCFEVNPSPAFSFYEGHTGQPIARAVAEYLAASYDARTSTPTSS